ncbi:MAG: ester cyclase [Thermomicrobiales bacterium]
MSAEAVVLAFIETVWNRGDLDRIPEFISPGYRVEGVAVGPGWVRENVAMFRNAFSGLRLIVERMVASGNDVAVMVRLDGRHTGTIKGFAATGRAVSCREAAFWEIDPETGLIVGGDFVADTLMARIQIGVVSPDLWRGPEG